MRRLGRTWLGASCAVLAGLAAGASAWAGGLDPEANTDGFDPVGGIYRIEETRRQNAIARQLEWNYRLLWEHGYHAAEPPVRQPIGFESKQVAPNRWIYRPLYAEDVAAEAEPQAGPELLPPPPHAPLELPAPAGAKPQDRIPPRTPRRGGGPREF